MAIRCVFLVPNHPSPCQVLHALGATPLMKRTQEQLRERYCTSGAFIACPVFARVEQGLVQANLLRPRPDPTAAVPSTLM